MSRLSLIDLRGVDQHDAVRTQLNHASQTKGGPRGSFLLDSRPRGNWRYTVSALVAVPAVNNSLCSVTLFRHCKQQAKRKPPRFITLRRRWLQTASSTRTAFAPRFRPGGAVPPPVDPPQPASTPPRSVPQKSAIFSPQMPLLRWMIFFATRPFAATSACRADRRRISLARLFRNLCTPAEPDPGKSA